MKIQPVKTDAQLSIGRFLTNYERKTAEYTVINSSVEKRAQNREKSTSGDYLIYDFLAGNNYPDSPHLQGV